MDIHLQSSVAWSDNAYPVHNHCQLYETWTLFRYKNQPRGSKNQVEVSNYKTLSWVSEKFHDTEFGNDFLVDTKYPGDKRTNRFIGLYWNTTFVSKDTVSRMAGGPVNGDELANPVSMGKCSGHKGLPQFADKKVTT